MYNLQLKWKRKALRESNVVIWLLPLSQNPPAYVIHSCINNSKNETSLNELKIGELFIIEAVI